MPTIITAIKKYKLIFLVCLFLIILIPLLSFIAKKSTKQINSISPTTTPYPLPPSHYPLSTIPSGQSSFHVVSTSPANAEQNVSSGEIIISFTTDIPLLSPTFNLSISPALPYYWKFVNSYPTNKIQAQVFGGLKTNTNYTVTVQDQKYQQIYSWTFTTSQAPAESSSNYVREQETKITNQYYPLLNYVPFDNNDFSIDYTDHLTLSVQIKNSNTDMVKQEVLDWIKSHGVDPSTHTINYTSQ